jgi:predicted Zn-dependent peptidase
VTRRLVVPVLLCAPVMAAVLVFLAPAARAQALEGKVSRITLDNGMRFLLVQRGTAPVFAANLRFRVGSVDDPGGESGLAHLFEHLAFKGTSTIGTRDAKREAEILAAMDRAVVELLREEDRGAQADAKTIESKRAELEDLSKRLRELTVKDEFSQILTGNGALGLNASTTTDLTSYVVSLPANRLELWCLLEAARLRDPVLREFYSERDVVMEERRMRIDNQPQGKLYEQLILSAFQAHSYRVPTVGWMSDLEHLTRPEAAEFRRAFYAPNNAVGTLVGDFDTAAAERLIRRSFGDIPPGPPPRLPVTTEPPQTGERRAMVQFDAEPELMIGFHKAVWPSPDDPVFQVIDSLLTSGRTSRLFRRLVLETQVASEVYSAEAPGDRYPNLFIIGAIPRAPHLPSEVEVDLLKELARLSSEPVTEREMQKVKNQLRASFLYPLRSNQGLAEQLSYYEIITGDWKNINVEAAAIQAVTREQVQDVARRTFVASNRTVAVLARPQDAAGPPPAGTGAAAPGGAVPGTAAPGAVAPGGAR